jgi:hypothetical protein
MSWTTAGDLKLQVLRRWERGELLRALVDETRAPIEPYARDAVRAADVSCCTAFPLRLVLKGPSSAELVERFDAVRSWISELAALPHVRMEWREINHRVLGPQRVPRSVWVDSLEAACAMIGKRQDAARFKEMLAFTRSAQPALLEWLGKRPLQGLELAQDWSRLLAVVEWVRTHPRPGIYLRQVDLPGVHSKFIEANRGVLADLLDLALLAHSIATDCTGVAQFAARYGFLDRPTRIRFRVLDARLSVLPGSALPDVALDAESFACLDLKARRVFITENETNFLAFPAAADAIVVFGAGYGWDALARAGWLRNCALHYWGDIDTHGFAILDQLRARFEHVESFLMDRGTLLAHQALWGKENDQVKHDLRRLTPSERALFDELRDNRLGEGVRLEQERVSFEWVKAALALVQDRDRRGRLRMCGTANEVDDLR